MTIEILAKSAMHKCIVWSGHSSVEVFKKHGNAYRRADSIQRSKIYPLMLKAAQALIEKDIAPQSWAEWRMAYYKKVGKKCPPMQVIFASKMILTKSGWFRKSYDSDGLYQSVVTRLNREQLCRTREAHRFNRGHRNPMLGLPKWYAEMRRDEIEKGAYSPIQFYPRLRADSSAGRNYLSPVSRSNWVDAEA